MGPLRRSGWLGDRYRKKPGRLEALSWPQDILRRRLMKDPKIAVIFLVFVFCHLLEICRDQEEAAPLIARFFLGDFAVQERKLPAFFWSHDVMLSRRHGHSLPGYNDCHCAESIRSSRHVTPVRR